MFHFIPGKRFPGCDSIKTWEETLHVKSVFPALLSRVFLQRQRMDRQLLRQRISVMKTNKLYVSGELAF